MPSEAAAKRSEHRATRHASQRMEERHNIVLTEELAATIIAAVEITRARVICDAKDLKACFDDGCIFTHKLANGLERWAVRIGCGWVRVVIAGRLIVTILPDLPKYSKSPKPRRSSRHFRQALPDRTQNLVTKDDIGTCNSFGDG